MTGHFRGNGGYLVVEHLAEAWISACEIVTSRRAQFQEEGMHEGSVSLSSSFLYCVNFDTIGMVSAVKTAGKKRDVEEKKIWNFREVSLTIGLIIRPLYPCLLPRNLVRIPADEGSP